MELKDSNKINTSTYFLRRKTKRDNIPMKDNTRKSHITIKLISLNEAKENFSKYSYIKFSFSDKISLNNLMEKKTQTIELETDQKEIYFIDIIELGNEKDTKKVNFLASIYVNKINTYYINIRQKKNSYYFEYIFYSKNMEKLPHFLQTSLGQQLNEFDNFNLKYRKRLTIINADLNMAKDYINKIKIQPGSYKICIRIKNKVAI